MLTGGRLDTQAKDFVAARYSAALNSSLCPNERLELCGRLTPGQSLEMGEYITNALGEVLCFTWDGALRHIGADGAEVYSTALWTRGSAIAMRYQDDGNVAISGRNTFGDDWWKWNTGDYQPGQFMAFHSFLSGPCLLLDAVALERTVEYGHTSYYGDSPTTTTTCTAAETCNTPAPAPVDPAAYEATRALADADYAIRIAQSLVAFSDAFGITNHPGTRTTDALPPSTPATPPAPRAERPYRALVVLYMGGGCDTFNILVPHSGCDDRDVAQQYVETRGQVALDLDAILQIDVPESNGQPCTKFGLHPDLPSLQQAFADGEALFVANVGALVEPVTKQQYLDKEKQLPAGLFAHNLMSVAAKTLLPQTTTGETGILGRIFQAFKDQAAAVGTDEIRANAYSITSSREMFRGSPVEPILLDSFSGMLTFEGSQTADSAHNLAEREDSLSELRQLTQKDTDSVFARTYNSAVRKAVDDSEEIAAKLADVTLTQSWPGGFAEQLKQVSTVIAARHALSSEADIFYIELGGFDMHSELTKSLHLTLSGAIEPALASFVAEMKAQGVWENVALLSMSEFGRTITTNGAGTDHAWGSNHFLMGGGVNGGNIRGQFPELRVDGPQSISGNAPMLPTSPWEAIWKGVALWVGVDESQLNSVMPNLKNFGEGDLIPYADLFR